MTIEERAAQILATPPWCNEPSDEFVERIVRVWSSIALDTEVRGRAS